MTLRLHQCKILHHDETWHGLRAFLSTRHGGMRAHDFRPSLTAGVQALGRIAHRRATVCRRLPIFTLSLTKQVPHLAMVYVACALFLMRFGHLLARLRQMLDGALQCRHTGCEPMTAPETPKQRIYAAVTSPSHASRILPAGSCPALWTVSTPPSACRPRRG